MSWLTRQVLAIKRYLLFLLVSTDFKEVPMRLMPNPFKTCRLYNLQVTTMEKCKFNNPHYKHFFYIFPSYWFFQTLLIPIDQHLHFLLQIQRAANLPASDMLLFPHHEGS
jgi:hypothetical protein